MKHKICILTFEYPPKIAGGLGTFCENLETGLTNKGVDAGVYMPGHGMDALDSELIDSFSIKTGGGVEEIEVRRRNGVSGRNNIVFFSSKNSGSPLNIKDVYRKKAVKSALFSAAFAEYYDRGLSGENVVLHANDYHAGLGGVCVKIRHPRTPLLYTIHLVHVTRRGGIAVYKSLLKKYGMHKLFDGEVLREYRVGGKSLIGNLVGQNLMEALSGEAAYLLEPLIAHYADKVNTVSRSYLKYDVRPPFSRFALPDDKFTYVFNGMKVDEMLILGFDGKRELRRTILGEYGLADGPLFINIGRQNTGQKATDVLASAIGIVMKSGKAADARFLIVAGERKLPPHVEKILAKIEVDYPENVCVFKKWVDDVTGYFKAADAFLLPSRYEPFGLTQIEAMTRGTPVIGSRTGGIRDVQVNHDGLIDGEYDGFKKPTGMLHGLGSAGGLATRILDMYDLIKNKPLEYRLLQNNAVDRAKYFTIGRTVGNYLRLYEDIIGKNTS